MNQPKRRGASRHPLLPELAQKLRSYAGALPIGLRGDILYLWATFRLRHRPLKMIGWIITLGAVCAAINWAGLRWARPQVMTLVGQINQSSLFKSGWLSHLPGLLSVTTTAMFSSLNVLSFISIIIMARTLRHLIRQQHLEMLQLVPGSFRPSALYYAVASRYIPLAFVAVLIIYLYPSPVINPMLHAPFVPMRPEVISLWPLYWASIRELSVLTFCPTNLFLDLAIAFWFFNQFRLTWTTVFAAAFFVSFVTPFFLMGIHEWIVDAVTTEIRVPGGALQAVAETIPRDQMYSKTVYNFAASVHYFATSILSVGLALLILGHLDSRWRRIVQSGTRDPILIKAMD